MKTIAITGAKGQLGRALTTLWADRKEIRLCLSDLLPGRENQAVAAGSQAALDPERTLKIGANNLSAEKSVPHPAPSSLLIYPLDLTKEEEVLTWLGQVKPDIIVNCAAFTNVNQCEEREDLARRVNGFAPGILARYARETGAILVHISTDYVFSGEGDRPYREEDVPDPQNAYGRTKLLGEEQVLASGCRYFLIRTAWLYGDGGNFVRTMLRLADSQEEVGVVCDQWGCPTSAKELARLIDYLLHTEAYGIYHGVCTGETTWYEFARTIFAYKGLSVKVRPLTTAEYPSPAKRPAYSVLDNEKARKAGYAMAHWKDALAEYLAEEEMRGRRNAVNHGKE